MTLSRRDALSLFALASCSGCSNLKHIAGLIPEVEPDPEPELPGEKDWVMRSSFLSDDASKPYGRSAGILSSTWSDSQFEDRLDWHKQQGDNTLHLALADEHDNAAPVWMYKTGNYYVGGTSLDMDQVGRMSQRMKAARRRGFKLVGWLTMDDSRSIHTAGTAALVRHANDCHRLFDKYLDAYCIGLEIDEDGRKKAGPHLVTALRAATDKNIWAHFTRGHKWPTALEGRCDGIMWQYGFGKSKAQLIHETEAAADDIDRRAPGFKLMAFEYSRFSDRSEGIGEALTAAGASHGYGCG